MNSKIKSESTTFQISELAAQLEISPHTIRYYEGKGLIQPERTAGNQRVYTRRDRARLKLILRGKRFGFSLDEIAEMIGMADTQEDEVDQIKKSIAYGKEKIAEIHKRKEDLALLEKDMRAMQEKLIKRLQHLQASQQTKKKGKKDV